MQDAFNEPDIEEVVIMTSAQVGKTTVLENVIAYFIDQDPSPILAVRPTETDAKDFSRERLTPMLRDTPSLRDKVHDVKTRDSGNTIMRKMFLGGFIAFAGANSPVGLSGRPIRIVLQDEIDKYPKSAGASGDPEALADKRATTFWNRKKGKFSTPTIKGESRIERAYNRSDMRKYYVPCPEFGEYQVMAWTRVKWPKGKPEDAYYECEYCTAELNDIDKIDMLRHGEWRAEKETKTIAGLWINEVSSPWVSFGNMAVRHTQATILANAGDTDALREFINESLAETWQEGTQVVVAGSLEDRKENYGPDLPAGVMVLVAGVDLQIDRIELELKGIGVGEESWGIQYKVFYGDPVFQDVCKE